mmetsp:Transcript_12762/g.38457  ORF Transcript_12762/g.38457 Transcript_12762/m.38457 type:complete len:255 (-) Transcript_12762:240-1004(-)
MLGSPITLDTSPGKRAATPLEAGEPKKFNQRAVMMVGKTPKSMLHEYFQLQGGKPEFELARELPSTPQDGPSFICKLVIPRINIPGGALTQTEFSGHARTKKAAEHAAADAAMRYIKDVTHNPTGQAGTYLAIHAATPAASAPFGSPTHASPRPESRAPDVSAAAPGAATLQGALVPEEMSDEELMTTINSMPVEDLQTLVLQAWKELTSLKATQRQLEQSEKALQQKLGRYVEWHRQARTLMMQDPLGNPGAL